jgi:hypothetical protein
MNAFYEHHKDSIRFGYRCFDRILLNGMIQPFQQPERVVGFVNSYRQLYRSTRSAAMCYAVPQNSSVSATFRPLSQGVDGLALLGGDDQRCWVAQAQGVSSASRLLGQLLTSLVSTSVSEAAP